MSRTRKQRNLIGHDQVTKRTGRRVSLTEERVEAFLELVEAGNHVVTSASACSIPKSTLYQWVSIGEDTRATLMAAQADAEAKGLPTPHPAHLATPYELRAMDLADRLAHARAKAEVKVIKSISKAIEGGFVLEEEPAVNGDGQPIYDEDGNLTYRRRIAPPDGKLGLEFLSRARPSEWGKQGPTQVEISGPGGTPIAIESGAQVAALSEKLAEHLALTAALREGEEIVDAEVVDDTSRSA